MFDNIKNQEKFNELFLKLAQIEARLINIEKIIKEKQRPIKDAENKTKVGIS